MTLARTHADLLAAFRLLHDSYVRAGLDTRNRRRVRITRHHLLPTTEVFVAKRRGEVIGTISMVVDSEREGLPMDAMYQDELDRLRGSGLRLAETGCMAGHSEVLSELLPIVGEFARLVVQVAKDRGIDAIVAATHPRHARFYVRALGYHPFTEIRECSYAAGNLAVGLLQRFEDLRGTKFDGRLFGTSYRPEDLNPTRWGDDTRRLLATLAPAVR